MSRIYNVGDKIDISNIISEITNFAYELGFHRFEVSKIALAVSEIATNILKHANKGTITFRVLQKQNGIEVLIEDNGDGIDDLEVAQQKGYSSLENSLGLGLYIARKSVDDFDITSKPGEGTKVMLRHYLPISLEKIEYGLSKVITKNGFYSCNKYVKEELNGDTVLLGLINGTLKNREISEKITDICNLISRHKKLKLEEIVEKCNQLIMESEYMEFLHYGLILLKQNQIEYIRFGEIFIKTTDFESDVGFSNQKGIELFKTNRTSNVVKQIICDEVIIVLSTFDYKPKNSNIEISDSAQTMSKTIIDNYSNNNLSSSVLILKRKG